MSTLKVKFLQMKTMATLNLAAATLLALATLGNCQLSRGPFIPRPSRPATPNEVAPLILVKEPVTIVPREHTPLFPFLGIIPGAKQCGNISIFKLNLKVLSFSKLYLFFKFKKVDLESLTFGAMKHVFIVTL